jgi:lipoate---protein ligase
MKLNFLKLNDVFIGEQLQLEEALLRADTENWCILNTGTAPAIVMGLSTQLNDVVDLKTYATAPIPIIRRFSGGGTVVVDEGTFFCTLIIRNTDLPCACNPQELLRWTRDVYERAFYPHQLLLEEHDYVLDGRKIGGNAQCFVKGGALHHTSFLWTWKSERMALLQMPPRQPDYRQNRPHELFCAQMTSYFASQEVFVASFENNLANQFLLEPVSLESAHTCMNRPHRKSTAVIR